MPLLASIDLGCRQGLKMKMIFRERPFPAGVPWLTTARLVDIDIQTIHLWLPAFESLRSLQLEGVYINTKHSDHLVHDDYHVFREALMALPSLRHLELFVKTFIVPTGPSRLPILLPMIQHLDVRYGRSPFSLNKPLRCIIATSLITLSLSNQNNNKPLEPEPTLSLELHFPSLQHLILVNVIGAVPDLTTLARTFPYIERLTFKPASTRNADALLYNIDHVLDTILYGAGDGDRVGNNAHSGLLWSQLQSIALSTCREALDVPRLQSAIIKLQAAGHPIRELLLPQEVHHALIEVGEIIEIKEFYVDWPTPFEW
ncbi:hypothetical protein FIBSPDRAFT_534547 [Athelia psychrophila]|uniref:F-box domain-containing protein n=1 Tax=Athelia psychrophila TaxID=1759441 RepID=A0A167THK1_9AGAM|nr:hypothetical protein FIBSPDRAFT_534547 [Fibularhizoctonia sp. CBS 109695]